MWIHWATAGILINTPSWKDLVSISLIKYLRTFLGTRPGFGEGVFTSLSQGLSIPSLLGKYPKSTPPGTSGPVGLMEELASSSTLERKSWLHKGNWRRLRNQLGALPFRLLRTWVQIIGLYLGGRRGDWSPLRDTCIALVGDKTMSFSFREWGRNVCECVCVSLTHGLATKQVWSPNPWVHGNSYGIGWALTGPSVWGLYRLTMAKRHLNLPQGTLPEMDKAN
jgi:hypothetical protein